MDFADQVVALHRQLEDALVASMPFDQYIKPSMYAWLMPVGYAGSTPAIIDEKHRLGHFPGLQHIIAPALIWCVYFGVLRIVLTALFFRPLAIATMKIEFLDQPENVAIAKFSKTAKKVRGAYNNADVEAFAKTSKLPLEDVRRYLYIVRSNAASETKITKYIEALWRFVFYSFFVYLGYLTLFVPTPVPWLEDTTQHWVGWDTYRMTPAVVFYYVIELGSYFHQLMWTEVTRSDAKEMILHHFTTITVMMLSFLVGFTRIGVSILLLHDVADIFLESAKVFNYISKAKGQKWISPVCDILFALFAVVFGTSRLYFYPKYLLGSLVFESPVIFKVGAESVWTGWYVFVALLGTLQCLHVFWFTLLCKAVYRMFTTGLDKDERSDDEVVVEEEFDTKELKKITKKNK